MAISLTEKIKTHLFNIPGFRTNRKIIIFETDDWGSIRMPSKEVFEYLLRKGYPVDKCPYNSNDCLESNEDVEDLMHVLDSVKDFNNNPAIFTMNQIVANPDFEKIKQSEFRQYYYEPFTETLKKYPNHDNVMNLYDQGIKSKLFSMQFHGREHVNISNWMKALKDPENIIIKEIFQLGMFSAHIREDSRNHHEFLDAFGTHFQDDQKNLNIIIDSGLELFRLIWNRKPQSFIAPCYIWPQEVSAILSDCGIRTLQSGRAHLVPKINSPGDYNIIRIYTGLVNKYGQKYTLRNSYFEPASNENDDWVDTCLFEINSAFFWNKPAIISSHRLNYIGSINRKNREQNLRMLKRLLQTITKKWVNAEFMSSDYFAETIFLNGKI